MDREEGFNVALVEEEWEQLEDNGFDITVLIGNGDPFNPEGDSQFSSGFIDLSSVVQA